MLIVAVLFATLHMNTLADTWISLAGGRDFLAHGVSDSRPFSFNSRPELVLPEHASAVQRATAWLVPRGWINQNWLSHVILYAVYRLGGGDALLVWKVLLYGAIAAVLLAASRARGVPVPVAAATIAVALVAGREFLEVRAQDHTNLAAAVLVLVLTLVGRRDVRWLWVLPALFAVWANLHGGYVFGILVAISYVGACWLAMKAPAAFRPVRDRTVAIGSAAIALSLAAAACSPYRLANLTHPIEISVGHDAALWRTITEWQPLLVNPGVSTLPFLAVSAAVALRLAGAAMSLLGGRARARGAGAAQSVDGRLDLPDAAMVALAVAMAFASRRFVPLAAIVTAVPLAEWGAEALSRRRSARARRATSVFGRHGAIAVLLAAAAAAGWLAVRFASTYLGPWPLTFGTASIFDRFTYEHLRPAGLCRFLAANDVHGRMWNFWEEGGFLAWDQTPAQPTGRIPVQVFIDGRAQGAYPADALREYYLLRGGGPAAQAAAAEGRAMTPQEIESARTWTRRRLATSGVWLADIAYAQQSLPISLLLLNTESWTVVYADEEHTLLADTDSPGGRALSVGIDSGATRFPDAFSAALTKERRALGTHGGGADLPRVVDLARAVFDVHPSARAVRLATAAAGGAADRSSLVAFLRGIVAEFYAGRDRYRALDGYGERLLAVEAALEGLGRMSAGGEAADLARQLDDVSRDRQGTLARVLW